MSLEPLDINNSIINPTIADNVIQSNFLEQEGEVQKIKDLAYQFFHSPLVWFFAAIIGAVVAFSAINLTFVGTLFMGISLAYLAWNPRWLPKPLLYELAIMANLVKNVFSQFFNKSYSYYHEILPNLYLGALPVKSLKHEKVIAEKLQLKAVLSIVEEFEITTPTFLSNPVNRKDWIDLGINHKVISVVDHTPLSLKDMHESADFIHKNKRVYVHCKSGMGRGPSAIIAYLIKYKGYTFKSAHSLIEEVRHIRVNSHQKLSLINFERLLKQNA